MIKKKEQELVADITKKFAEASSDWSENRQDAVKDFKFYDDEQYDDAKARAVAAAGAAPLITNNQIPAIVKTYESALRQMNVGINVHPTDEAGSDETAEVLQGLIRHVEGQSNARSAYINAAGENGALVPGWGFVKIKTDYVSDPESFDQEIYIEPIKDCMTILPDYQSKRVDLEDAEYVFEFEEMSKEKYMSKYNLDESELCTIKEWDLIGSKLSRTGWITKTTVRVARFWFKERSKSTTVLYSDGTIHTKYTKDSHMSDMVVVPAEEQPDPTTVIMVNKESPKEIENKRVVTETIVKWVDTNGYEVIAEGEWHNNEFPFVMFVGNDRIVDGKRKICGAIKYAKDAQKIFNYTISQFVRKQSAANRSPVFIDDRAIPDEYKHMYETANTEDWPFMPFRGIDDAGNVIANPIIKSDVTEPAVQGLLTGAQLFQQNIRAAMGFPENTDTTMSGGNGQSGVALETLAQNGMESNSHYSNNMVMSIRAVGKKVLDLIPYIYDRPERVVRIIGADQKSELVKINAILNKGKMKGRMHDVKNSNGMYEVVVDTGQSYATRQAQQSAQLLEFARVFPAMSNYIVDLIARNLDFDTSHALAERMVKVQANLYPWLTDQGDMEDWPSEAKAALGSYQKQVQEAQMHLVQIHNAYQQLLQEKQAHLVDNEGKLQLQKLKSETDIQLKRMELAQTEFEARVQAVHDHTKMKIDHIEHTQKITHDTMIHNSKVANAHINTPNPSSVAPGGGSQ